MIEIHKSPRILRHYQYKIHLIKKKTWSASRTYNFISNKLEKTRVILNTLTKRWQTRNIKFSRKIFLTRNLKSHKFWYTHKRHYSHSKLQSSSLLDNKWTGKLWTARNNWGREQSCHQPLKSFVEQILINQIIAMFDLIEKQF